MMAAIISTIFRLPSAGFGRAKYIAINPTPPAMISPPIIFTSRSTADFLAIMITIPSTMLISAGISFRLIMSLTMTCICFISPLILFGRLRRLSSELYRIFPKNSISSRARLLPVFLRFRPRRSSSARVLQVLCNL